MCQQMAAAALLWLAVLFTRPMCVACVACFGVARPISSTFFMFQLADPQLGMLHCCGGDAASALNWTQELAMLQLAIGHANRLRPRFVTLHGDMQNWYATDLPGENGALGPESGLGDVGALQVADVKEALAALDPAIPVRVLAGNHDVGDAPTLATLEQFRDRWGPMKYSSREGGTEFVVLDSQVYYDASQPGVREVQLEQTAWLRRTVAATQASNATSIVVLTHIPPFMTSMDEPHGWANWPLAARHEVLGILTKPNLRLTPRLIICGHFHSNSSVSSDSPSSQVKSSFEVVTTASVGTELLWNGRSTFTPTEALPVASTPSGSDAFNDFIARTDGVGAANYSESYLLTRRDARADWSGVRIFEFSERGYRHRWFTNQALSMVQSLDGETLAHEPWKEIC
ncbi:unnamed protein product [Polarella glacialis]|uniref:Calcineurin-like phosphoesterase domain-containing protein n=1 Tax=Polarella glacialis TaxID=89957 RepID=A0A813KPE0_POLGL|nr:unnamed protein product [Polarella glacialis]CAE8704750.1 unnamed protein product [Polarella glacialis]